MQKGGGAGRGLLLPPPGLPPPPPLARVAAHLACGVAIALALAPVLWRAERAALRAGAAAVRGS